eukprot:scaffold263074_cov18-Prasinocladus_malaysianus.AAC.1
MDTLLCFNVRSLSSHAYPGIEVKQDYDKYGKYYDKYVCEPITEATTHASTQISEFRVRCKASFPALGKSGSK